MIEVLVVLVVLYFLSVVVTWGLIKLIFDDVPAKYALIPVLNIILPFLDVERGRVHRRTGVHPRTTPGQELDREQARQYRGPPPPWRPM